MLFSSYVEHAEQGLQIRDNVVVTCDKTLTATSWRPPLGPELPARELSDHRLVDQVLERLGHGSYESDCTSDLGTGGSSSSMTRSSDRSSPAPQPSG